MRVIAFFGTISELKLTIKHWSKRLYFKDIN